MSKKTWIIFAAVCIAVLGGLIISANGNRINVDSVKLNEVQKASEQSGGIADHTYGKTDSKVVLIEYGDFQCPGCGSAHPAIKTVAEKYKEKIVFVFRNFPLTSMHPNAKFAAAAAEAAGKQGKYWEMHNLLYESQEQWSNLSSEDRTEKFRDYARQIDLDINAYSADIASSSVTQKINFDLALGKKVGVTGTPAFFLNGESIEQYVLDGKLVNKGTSGANPIWTDAEALDKFVIQPALAKNGIDIKK